MNFFSLFRFYRNLLIGCDGACDSHDLLLPWQQKSWWTYSGVFSSQVDRERYWEVVCHALRKYFNEDSMVSTNKMCCIYLTLCLFVVVVCAPSLCDHNIASSAFVGKLCSTSRKGD